MYTQCPNCRVAFRVTAGVLQQAGGRVRCGNCSRPFNALDRLSESPPTAHEGVAPPDNAASEEDRREFMNTLNRLGGPDDVRIEDTGVEWRVVDDDPAGSPDKVETTGNRQAPDEQGHLGFDDQMRFDDNTPLPEGFGDDDEPSGVWETPRRRASDFEFTVTEVDDTQAELELSEPDDWADLLDEMSEIVVAESDEEPADEITPPGSGDDALPYGGMIDDAGAPDHDSRVDADEAYEHSFTIIEDVRAPETESRSIDDGQSSREDPSEQPKPQAAETTGETQAVDADPGESDEDELQFVDDADQTGDDDESDAAEASGDTDAADEVIEASESAEIDAAEEAVEMVEADPDSAAETDEDREPDDDVESSGRFEQAIASAEQQDAGEERPESGSNDARRNRAAETGNDLAAMTASMNLDPETLKALQDETLVETIIMEGDRVRGALDDDDDRARFESEGEDPASLLDTYITSRSPEQKDRSVRLLMTGGIVALLLVLGVQLLHYQREYLATLPFFDRTMAPVYRSLGMPITPDWNIRGWQFEATSGATAGDDDLLTITSRISNRSGTTLPYPLVHVSLTDRYEEVIGSRMLEPEDYLPPAADPAEPVPAGDDFTATISIASTSPDATGFKLNVCYREADQRLRCAIEDFKEP